MLKEPDCTASRRKVHNSLPSYVTTAAAWTLWQLRNIFPLDESKSKSGIPVHDPK
jgi:hypothetical protein